MIIHGPALVRCWVNISKCGSGSRSRVSRSVSAKSPEFVGGPILWSVRQERAFRFYRERNLLLEYDCHWSVNDYKNMQLLNAHAKTARQKKDRIASLAEHTVLAATLAID